MRAAERIGISAWWPRSKRAIKRGLPLQATIYHVRLLRNGKASSGKTSQMSAERVWMLPDAGTFRARSHGLRSATSRRHQASCVLADAVILASPILCKSIPSSQLWWTMMTRSFFFLSSLQKKRGAHGRSWTTRTRQFPLTGGEGAYKAHHGTEHFGSSDEKAYS